MAEPTAPLWGSHQAFVDEVIHRCLGLGSRTRDDLTAQVLTALQHHQAKSAELGPTGLELWHPSLYEIHIAISRTCSRTNSEGLRAIWSVPGQPHRYLSLSRLRSLVRLADSGVILSWQVRELLELKKDLGLLIDHWKEKGKTAFFHAGTLEGVLVEVELARLDLSDAIQESLFVGDSPGVPG